MILQITISQLIPKDSSLEVDSRLSSQLARYERESKTSNRKEV